MNLDHHRRQQDRAATLTAVLVAGTGAAGALSSAVEHAVTLGLAVLVGLTLLVGLARWARRVLRERREDVADALVGAAWRAEHMPHLAAAEYAQRAGVA